MFSFCEVKQSQTKQSSPSGSYHERKNSYSSGIYTIIDKMAAKARDILRLTVKRCFHNFLDKKADVELNIIEGLEAREIHKNIDDMAKIFKEMTKSTRATDGYKQSLYRYFMSQRTELELKLGLVKDVESFQPKSYESNSFVQVQGEERAKSKLERVDLLVFSCRLHIRHVVVH